ncbi:NAD(P)/FAD-dependent oxidoreductase, partial [Stenotrophomonas rhizophila]|uniref:NAD(P)/FAD-dependent oxidoreductase n=1 Tax=Stenotrophomonas rhizophila TaxID=216778 RepID=UPI0028D7024E
MTRDTLPHLVIIGGGFAGLWATRALASARVRITLVDRRNHHLFQPLLYQVATAGLSAPDIAAPLRHILGDQRNVEVRLGEVTSIDKQARQITLADGSHLGYDTLMLCTGATHAYFGHDEWAADAPGLKTLDDAIALRRKLLLAFERAEAEPDPARKAAWLSFAVVGGGPTGVELAGTLAEIARHTLRNEFRHIDPASAKVRLVEAGPRVLSTFPEVLSLKARRQLEKLGVEVLTGTPVSDINGDGFQLGNQFVPARTVVWAAGVAASPLARTLEVPLDRAGRVPVQPDLTIEGHPEIFVAGDLAALSQADGRPVPGVAPAAKQMGKHVAAIIRARLDDKPAPGAFKYQDFGNLATIGRMAAIVHLGKLQLSGVLAWWFWLAAHVFFLIGFRNRIVVLL